MQGAAGVAHHHVSLLWGQLGRHTSIHITECRHESVQQYKHSVMCFARRGPVPGWVHGGARGEAGCKVRLVWRTTM